MADDTTIVASSPEAVAPAQPPSDAAPAAAASPPVAAATSPEPVIEAVVEAKEPAFTPHTAEATALAANPPDASKVEDKPAETPAEAKAAEKVEAPEPKEAKPEDKPAEPKPEAEAPLPVVEAPPLAPVEYKYSLPETVKLDDALKTELHGALDEFRANPAEGAQKLLDMYARETTRFAEEYDRQSLANQHAAFANTRKEWKTRWAASEDIGGAGYDTSLKAMCRVRDLVVSSAKPGTPQYQNDWNEFLEFCAVTGAGDHPAFARLLHNAARFVDEAPIAPPNARNGAALAKVNARPPGSFKEVMYDHPRSASGP